MSVFDLYISMLFEKYRNVICNRWFWIVLALIVVVAFFAYAFYCTSRGYNYAGGVNLYWPKHSEMGIRCRR